MVNIRFEKYTSARVCTIRVSNKKLLWQIMYDVQEGIGVKNMSDLVRKEIWGIFRTKNATKDEIKKYKISTATFVYVCSGFMSRIIKNCRSEKKSQKKTTTTTILSVN